MITENIQKNDVIRSYDFKPMYGRGSRVGEIVMVPREVMIMEYPGRVINLTRI